MFHLKYPFPFILTPNGHASPTARKNGTIQLHFKNFLKCQNLKFIEQLWLLGARNGYRFLNQNAMLSILLKPISDSFYNLMK